MPRSCRRLDRAGALLLLAAAVGCSGREVPSRERPALSGTAGTAPAGTDDLSVAAYCRVAATPGLRSWHRDVVTHCQPGETDEAPSCSVSAVQEDGRLVDTGIRGAVLARRLAGNRTLIRTQTGAIEVVEPGGTARTRLAAWGLGPGVSPDGHFVAFVTVSNGVAVPDDEAPGPDVPRQLALWTVGSSPALRVVYEAPLLMAGWPFPAGSDVAFTSVHGGLASLWRVNVARPVAFQVTNQGLDAVGPGFVPPPGDEAQWIGPGAVLAYEAPLDTAMHVWAVDLERGETANLGSGEWPVPLAGGDVMLRRSRARGGSCAVRVAGPGHR